MLTDINAAQSWIGKVNPAMTSIGVRRVPETETSILAAATAWARALTALEQRQ